MDEHSGTWTTDGTTLTLRRDDGAFPISAELCVEEDLMWLFDGVELYVARR